MAEQCRAVSRRVGSVRVGSGSSIFVFSTSSGRGSSIFRPGSSIFVLGLGSSTVVFCAIGMARFGRGSSIFVRGRGDESPIRGTRGGGDGRRRGGWDIGNWPATQWAAGQRLLPRRRRLARSSWYHGRECRGDPDALRWAYVDREDDGLRWWSD